MIYENVIDVINSVRTKKFRVTTSNGENKVMRLFVSASNSICQIPTAKARGRNCNDICETD